MYVQVRGGGGGCRGDSSECCEESFAHYDALKSIHTGTAAVKNRGEVEGVWTENKDWLGWSSDEITPPPVKLPPPPPSTYTMDNGKGLNNDKYPQGQLRVLSCTASLSLLLFLGLF